MASPESPRHTLSKEVLPPQKPQNGVGVMLVAAAAMFFAVASSALILRSRMAGALSSTGNLSELSLVVIGAGWTLLILVAIVAGFDYRVEAAHCGTIAS